MGNDAQTDHVFITILLFVIGTVAAAFGVLVRGWFKHVNDSLREIFQRLNDENKAREKRWTTLNNHCREHSEKLSELRGKFNGVLKVKP